MNSNRFTINRLLLLFIAAELALFSIGCQKQMTSSLLYSENSSGGQASAEYQIQPGDQLELKFFYNPELNESVVVRPDGKISLQLIDDVQAADRSPQQLDDTLTQLYAYELRDPELTVIVKGFATQNIFVGGEVNVQGIVPLTAGMTPFRAVIRAGGLKETAQPREVIVIRKGPDNHPVPIRVDLQSALYAKNNHADMQLQPNDIVYVPKTFIAEANKFVHQYIEKLFLFNGISLGFNSETNRLIY